MIDIYAGATFALRRLPPETAHRLTLEGLKLGLPPCLPFRAPDCLAVEALGMRFPNPLGVAAGFDKDGEVPDAMLRLGFGYAEVGSTTPRPQTGNPVPRVFRLPRHKAVINRLGFNNQGHAAMRVRLAGRTGRPGVVGVNLGANRDSTDKVADYVAGIEAFESLANYFTINISSPNTPGLRDLQHRAALTDLVVRVMQARRTDTPVLLKIAPDLTEREMQDIAEIALEHNISGLVVSNTTLARQGLVEGPSAQEEGGLSGRPLMAPSTRVLATMRTLTEGRLLLIGVGGISTGEDAYTKIRAGAGLLQLYTGLVYEGPGLVRRINKRLARLLKRDGFLSVAQAVGADVSLGHKPAADRARKK